MPACTHQPARLACPARGLCSPGRLRASGGRVCGHGCRLPVSAERSTNLRLARLIRLSSVHLAGIAEGARLPAMCRHHMLYDARGEPCGGRLRRSQQLFCGPLCSSSVRAEVAAHQEAAGGGPGGRAGGWGWCRLNAGLPHLAESAGRINFFLFGVVAERTHAAVGVKSSYPRGRCGRLPPARGVGSAGRR